MNRRHFIKVASALASGLIVPEEIVSFLQPRKVQIIVPEKITYRCYLVWSELGLPLIPVPGSKHRRTVKIPEKNMAEGTDLIHAIQYAMNWDDKVFGQTLKHAPSRPDDAFRLGHKNGDNLTCIRLADEERFIS